MTERDMNLTDTLVCAISCNISFEMGLIATVMVYDKAMTGNNILVSANIYKQLNQPCQLCSHYVGNGEYKTLNNALNELYTSRTIKRYPRIVMAIKNTISEEINLRTADLMTLSAEVFK